MNLCYTDDTVIIVHSQEALPRRIDRLTTKGKRLGLNTNIDKTKIMVVGRTPNVDHSELQ